MTHFFSLVSLVLLVFSLVFAFVLFAVLLDALRPAGIWRRRKGGGGCRHPLRYALLAASVASCVVLLVAR